MLCIKLCKEESTDLSLRRGGVEILTGCGAAASLRHLLVSYQSSVNTACRLGALCSFCQGNQQSWDGDTGPLSCHMLKLYIFIGLMCLARSGRSSLNGLLQYLKKLVILSLWYLPSEFLGGFLIVIVKEG